MGHGSESQQRAWTLSKSYFATGFHLVCEIYIHAPDRNMGLVQILYTFMF